MKTCSLCMLKASAITRGIKASDPDDFSWTLSPFHDDGYAIVRENELCGIIDGKENYVVEPTFNAIYGPLIWWPILFCFRIPRERSRASVFPTLWGLSDPTPVPPAEHITGIRMDSVR